MRYNRLRDIGLPDDLIKENLLFAAQKVGVFGKLVKLDAALKPGDRIEIYRGIIADPETVPRRDTEGD